MRIVLAITGCLLLRTAPLAPDHAAQDSGQEQEIDTDGDVCGALAGTDGAGRAD